MTIGEATPFLVGASAAALFLAERVFPLRAARHALMPRLIVNLVFAGLAFAIAYYVVKPAALLAIGWRGGSELSVLSVFDDIPVVRVCAAFLTLDLSFYYWHRLNHKASFLWRFHNVHHFDGDLDVTTAARFHPVEVIFSALFRIIQVSVLGVTLAEYVAYELIFQLATFFHHSNTALPERVDSLLTKILVTPRMHGIHHSQYRDETNSNFSVVLSLWDRAHGTLELEIPVAELTIGVPGYPAADYSSPASAFLSPFKRQEEYWKDAAGRTFYRRPEVHECSE